MKVVYAALESCDVIVLGSPVYFDNKERMNQAFEVGIRIIEQGTEV